MSKKVTEIDLIEIINIFTRISDSIFNEKLHVVLMNICEAVRNVLKCDLVVVMPSFGNGVERTDVVWGGSFHDQSASGDLYTTLKLNEKMLSEQTRRIHYFFFDNELGPQSFYEREKIKSSVIFSLGHNNKYLGSFSFYYREEQEFTPEIRKIHQAFLSLANAALLNAENVEIIKRQRTQLQENVERLGFEYSELLDKMERMLPVANAKTLSDIVRSINHDIRNHLIRISQNLKDLNLQVRDSRNENMALSQIIQKDINNVSNLIYLFEPDSFKISIESLPQILERVIDLFSYNLGPKIEMFYVESEIREIRCVKAELSMIFYNLISNASYAIYERWSSVKNKFADARIDVKMSFDKKNSTYYVEVEDNGNGIMNENMDKLFDPGFTTKKNGLGIGLYFVRETIYSAYAGDISVTSKLKRGSKFSLSFKDHI